GRGVWGGGSEFWQCEPPVMPLAYSLRAPSWGSPGVQVLDENLLPVWQLAPESGEYADHPFIRDAPGRELVKGGNTVYDEVSGDGLALLRRYAADGSLRWSAGLTLSYWGNSPAEVQDAFRDAVAVGDDTYAIAPGVDPMGPGTV